MVLSYIIVNVFYLPTRFLSSLFSEHICFSSHNLCLLVSRWSCVRWQDVVVGAPQFFMKDGDVGGAIYVYINKKGVWKNVKPIRIDGTKDSMFGLSVENIGDVNLDTYEGLQLLLSLL